MHPGDVYETGFDESTANHLDGDAACPECDGTAVADGGERHCTDCGLVVTEYRIDHGATAQAFHDAGATEGPMIYLYDEYGFGIRHRNRLEAVLTQDDRMWIVPAEVRY